MNNFNEQQLGNLIEVPTQTADLLSSQSEVLKSYISMMSDFFISRGIPINDTTYNSETGEFILEFTTLESSQAYDGICHGGFSATVLDALSRIAILNEGSEEERDNFTYQASTKYMRKVTVGSTIRIVGKIDTSEGAKFKSTAYIMDVTKPTKVLTKYALDMTGDIEDEEMLNENSSNENKGKSLKETSKESEMLEQYLSSSHEYYQTYGISIDEVIWDQEKKEVTLELTTSKLNCVDGSLQEGVIATLLDTLAGLPVFLESSQEGKIALSDELKVTSLRKIKEGITIKITGKIENQDEQKSVSTVYIVDAENPKQVLAKGSLSMNIR